MNILDVLMNLEDRIWKLRLKRSKKVYLSIKEIQEIMKKGEPMPTSIFNAEKKEYIVKARTIYGPKQKRK